MRNLLMKMIVSHYKLILQRRRDARRIEYKKINFRLVPFILFIFITGCSNALNSIFSASFSFTIEEGYSENGIYYSRNPSPVFKFSNVKAGALVTLHEDAECAGVIISEDAVPTVDQVDIQLKESIVSDGSETYYAKHALGENIFNCIEINYVLDRMAARPTLALGNELSSPSTEPNLSFLVSDLEIGSEVSLHTDSNCIDEKVTSSIATGTTLTIATALNSDGTYNYYAKQVDRIGNISNCSSVVEYVLDRENPSEPSIGLAQGTTSPSSNVNPNFLVSGVEDGATVSLHMDDACSDSSSAIGTASSNSITLESIITNGNDTYNYYAKQVDGAGNASSCSNLSAEYILDDSLFGIPVVGLAGTGTSPSQNTNPSFLITNIEDGATVTLHTDSACSDASQTASGTSSGDFITLSLATSLTDDETYTYYAKQIKPPNSACSSTGLTYVLDRVAPTVPSLVLGSPSRNLDPSFVVSGVENEATVGLYTDSSCTEANKVASGTATASSITLSLATSLTDDKTYIYYVKQVDRASNSSNCSNAVEYELDTNALAPTIALPSGLTSPSTDTTPSFSVSGLEIGGVVSLYTDSTCTDSNKIASKTVASSSISIEVTISSDGIYNYYAKQVDSLGNASFCSSALEYELDITALTPTIALPSGGTSPSTDTTPSFSVSGLEIGAVVSLYTDSTCTDSNQIASKTVASSSISIEITVGSDGIYNYYAKQVDSLGNVSSCSSVLEYELDTTVLTPTIALPSGGTSPSTDTTPSFSVSGLEIGSVVSLYTDSTCTDSNKISSETVVSSSISIEITISSDGTYNYYAKQVDSLGNASSCSSPLEYELDTTALTPIIALPSGGTSPSTDTTPSFSVSGLEIGGVVSLYTDSTCTDSNKISSETVVSSSISIEVTISSDGTYSYYAKQVDSLGNASSCSSVLEYELDTTALTPTIALPSGLTSPSTDTTPSFSVSGLEIGGVVSLHTDSTCTDSNQIASKTVASSSISIEITVGSDGIYNYYAKQVDSLGNVSSCSSVLEYELDTTVLTPTIALPSGGTSPSTDTTPSFSVSGLEIGSVVSLYTDSTCTDSNKISSETVVSSSISIEITISSDGTYNYYAKQVDSLGNASSCSSPLEYELDTTALTPIIALPSGGTSPSTDTTPSFSVSGLEIGGVVSLYTDSTCTDSNKISSETVVSSSISIEITISSDGIYNYYAKQVDSLGNASSCSSVLEYELDTTALTPTIALPSGGTSPSTDTTPSFSVSGLEIGSVVSLYTDSTCTDSNKISSETVVSSSISVDVTISSDGTYNYYAKQVDSLGNISSCSSALEYELDTTALTPTIALPSGRTSPSNNATPSFSVSGLEIGGVVSLYTDSTCTDSNQIASKTVASGSVSIEITIGSDGIYNYYAKQVDSLGNISSCSSVLEYELDRTNPPEPSIALAQGGISPSTNTNPNFLISDVEDGAMVSLYTDSTCTDSSQVASGTATASTITLGITLSSYGTYTYYAKQVNDLGTASNCSSSSVIYEFIEARVVELSMRSHHNCIILNDSTLKCWGRNIYGQLGDGTTTNQKEAVAVPNLTNVTQLSLGIDHTCALLDDSTVKCWGRNIYGQLGDGTTSTRAEPTAVSSLTNVTQISSGNYHNCALLSDDTVKCWGRNNYGELGNSIATNQTSPVDVSSLTDVTQISLGGYHTCALLSDATVECWGWNTYGQLGNGTTTNQTSPVDVSSLTDVTQIVLGARHTCALLDDATVECWGWNTYGQLGNGSTASQTEATAIADLADVTQIALGGYNTCALLDDKTAKCWGANSYGQLGFSSAVSSTTPTAVPDLTDIAQIAFGDIHACAYLTNSAVKCWGSNNNGQLGDGTTEDKSAATPVIGFPGVASFD